jgi:hypothetical protein
VTYHDAEEIDEAVWYLHGTHVHTEACHDVCIPTINESRYG